MNLAIDRTSSEPAYEQICRQVEQLVDQGLLKPGTRLPSIRQLAQSLGLANSTVAIAYDVLSSRQIIETRRGSGTYIATFAGPEGQVNLERLAEQSASGPRASMQWGRFRFESDFFGMPVTRNSGKMIRFTQAAPDPSLFPLDRIKQVSSSMLWNPQSFYFEWANPQGYQPLVEHLEREMALQGIPMAEGQNDIILTAGFQRALSLLLTFLLRDGEKVAIESPCFTHILNLLIANRIGFVPIPVDSEGMDTEYLAKVLARGEVKAIITIPTCHNPTGATLSAARRTHLLDLAAQHQTPIIEDDWARLLRYDGVDTPPLKAIDSGNHVIHIGTYSKSLLPGLRIGWITCPSEIAIQLVRAKAGCDSSDSQFLQALLYNFIEGGFFHRHIRHTTRHYRRRRDAMCSALDHHLPPGCRYNRPSGGFSVWLELPAHIKSMPLLRLARERGVEFGPSAFMTPDRQDTSALRLAFSRLNEEEIGAGVELLCECIKDAISKPELLIDGYKDYKDLYK
jgi:DNA-binding transcriptional MocR family regulator